VTNATRRLGSLEDVTGSVRLPRYDRSAIGVGIVHIGTGAFHRAHQAVMTEEAIEADGGDWRIRGISLRSRSGANALNPQDGLYTLTERSEAGSQTRVIGALADVIAVDAAATLEALCDPAIRVVTLTVTEKGYGIDRPAAGPDWKHPAVAADRNDPERPTGVLGLLTEALRRRRSSGVAPFTVLSCDNLPHNGALVRGGVIGFARERDRALGDFIEAEVAFPSCMVDRITPAPTEATFAYAEQAIGCRDLAAIETEPFIQWVIEDNFCNGRPRWEAGGALFVSDVSAYERMKLTMLNGTHSALAYAGFLSGRKYVRDVMADDALAVLVARHLDAAMSVMPDLEGIDLGEYAEALRARFRNPAIEHQTYQIAMDGTEKLPQRIFAPAMAALNRGLPIDSFGFATAAWIRYTLGETDSGEKYALRDPREEELGKALAGSPREATALLQAFHRLPGLFPAELERSPEWRLAVEKPLTHMLNDGMAAALNAFVKR